MKSKRKHGVKLFFLILTLLLVYFCRNSICCMISVKLFHTVPKVECFESSKSNYNALYFSWKKIPLVTGYEIYEVKSEGKYKKIKTVTWNTDNCAVKDLKGNTEYKMAIRAYLEIGKRKFYSDVYTETKGMTCKDYSKKTLYVDGDSIAYGTGAGGYSFADALSKKYGFQLTKQATPGSLLSTSFEGKGHIVESVAENYRKPYDYVLLDGGVNDYIRSSKIGEVGELDPATTVGALEIIFSHIHNVSPRTKIYFILPHKIYDKITFKDTTKKKNRQGKTYLDYRNAMIHLVEVVGTEYNVELIDCFELFDATKWFDRQKYTAVGDGIHPRKGVQIEVYTPFIASKMNLE